MSDSFETITVRCRCPKCGKKRSYTTNSVGSVNKIKHVKIPCFKCKKKFIINGNVIAVVKCVERIPSTGKT